MLKYFLRRLLLVVPTFLGITLVCFALTQFVPGGPVEQRLLRSRRHAGHDFIDFAGQVGPLGLNPVGEFLSERLDCALLQHALDIDFAQLADVVSGNQDEALVVDKVAQLLTT